MPRDSTDVRIAELETALNRVRGEVSAVREDVGTRGRLSVSDASRLDRRIDRLWDTLIELPLGVLFALIFVIVIRAITHAVA